MTAAEAAENQVLFMYYFWVFPHGKVTGNIGSNKKRVTDEWNVNGIQWITYSERAADLDHFEWSHVHPRQNT